MELQLRGLTSAAPKGPSGREEERVTRPLPSDACGRELGTPGRRALGSEGLSRAVREELAAPSTSRGRSPQPRASHRDPERLGEST